MEMLADGTPSNASMKLLSGMLKLSGVTYGYVNDTSQNDIWFYKYFYQILVPILFGTIIVIGVVGNVMVIVVIIIKTNMRTRINILLMNLALSDIVFLVVCVPFVTYHYAADNWLIGEAICKISQYLIYVTVYVTMYTLVAISVVRYLFVVYTHQSARYTNKKAICLVVFLIWVVNALANTHILMNYEIKYSFVYGSMPYRYCGMESIETGRRVLLSFFLLAYVTPLVLISTFYLLLLRHLNVTRQSSSLRHLNKRSDSTNNSANRKKRQRKSATASKILVVVVIVLTVCWLPLHTHFLIVYFTQQPKSRAYEIFRVMCHCLAYSNSCMNPIIYNYVSTDFRKSFKTASTLCPLDIIAHRPKETETLPLDHLHSQNPNGHVPRNPDNEQLEE